MNMGSAYHKQSTWKTSKRGLAFIDLLLQKRQGYGVGRWKVSPIRHALKGLPPIRHAPFK